MEQPQGPALVQPQMMVQPQFVQPPFVMMPMPTRNGLGLFGFLVALIGLVIPTGIVAMLGLVLSLAAIGRSPRGLATCGVILGLLGTVFWLGVTALAVLVGLVAALAAALAVAAAFVLTQPEVVEVTSDMVNVVLAVEEYQQQNDEMPAGLDDLALGVAATTDPWGGTYRLEKAEQDPGFDVVSGGPDGEFETLDDVRLTALDRVWEDAFEGFEGRLEELGERFEHLEHAGAAWDGCSGNRYEVIARRDLLFED